MYHYTECGLDNIYLINGFKEADTEYGKAFSVLNVDGLHKAIGLSVTEEPRPLCGDEIRFLRKELDLSQKKLGLIMAVKDQTVARWEKDQVSIPQPSDILLREYYRETILADGNLTTMINLFTEIDRELVMQEHVFEEESKNWTAKLAA